MAPTSGFGEPGETHAYLLGSFELKRSGSAVALADGAAHLLAFLAVAGRPVERLVVATNLWPDAATHRAYGNLRSVLARAGRSVRGALCIGHERLSLADHVRVDWYEGRATALRILEADTLSVSAHDAMGAVSTLSSELLSGWHEEWVISAQEPWRELRLQALETLADQLLAADRYACAAVAAHAAIQVEPLRESAYSGLIRVHLAQGNQAEALRQYERYRLLLWEALGVEPTERLRHLTPTAERRS